MTEPVYHYQCMSECDRIAYCRVTVEGDGKPCECPFGDGMCEWTPVGEADEEAQQ
jgi:hypothetical protein